MAQCPMMLVVSYSAEDIAAHARPRKKAEEDGIAELDYKTEWSAFWENEMLRVEELGAEVGGLSGINEVEFIAKVAFARGDSYFHAPGIDLLARPDLEAKGSRISH